jgi:thioredoxin reductase
MNTKRYDVVVVGGGAAGLSAALVLGRARRHVAVVDAGSPRNAPADHMHGFLSRDGLAPKELLATGRAELQAYGVEVIEDDVVEAEPGFVVRLAGDRTLTARRLLVATGAVDVLPAIEGARERWGRDFLHCPYCHGWEVRDRPLGVVGTIPGAAEHAQLLRQWSEDVVFFSHTHPATGDEHAALAARGIPIVDGVVTRLIVENDRLRAVQLDGDREVPRDALFMRPTLEPRGTKLIASLGCELDDTGFVRTDRDGRTSVAGVWSAGNVSNPRAQAITAAGEGSAAAISINTDLVQEDTKR